jgi:hypothetical protein
MAKVEVVAAGVVVGYCRALDHAGPAAVVGIALARVCSWGLSRQRLGIHPFS